RPCSFRDVLLSELCARNGGGERLEAAGDKLCQAHQYSWRLRPYGRAPVHAGAPPNPLRRGETSSMRNFYVRAGMGQKVTGTTLVGKDGFSARYDLDRVRGVFSRPQHKLAGENYLGRILVLDAAKGGVATAWMLYEMKSRGVMPAALVLNAVN